MIQFVVDIEQSQVIAVAFWWSGVILKSKMLNHLFEYSNNI